jgi:hypothetical protein
MRGKSRRFGSYLASRGWLDTGVQKVVQKWAILGCEVANERLRQINRVMENS